MLCFKLKRSWQRRKRRPAAGPGEVAGVTTSRTEPTAAAVTPEGAAEPAADGLAEKAGSAVQGDQQFKEELKDCAENADKLEAGAAKSAQSDSERWDERTEGVSDTNVQ